MITEDRWFKEMLRELGQESPRVEYLEVPLGPPLQPIALRLGKRPTGVLLGLVDDLPALGHLDQPRIR